MIRLFVGLGNPGSEYEATRHNVGFWWIDQLAQQWNIPLQARPSDFGWVGTQGVGDAKIWLLKPSTFMNLSGQSVSAVAKFFKIPLDQILVIHDELDLPAGEVKLKQGGGHAGHNGLRDIHARMGGSDYWRLRIGIGHPGIKSEVANWVLNKPSPDQRIGIEQAIERSLKAAEDLRDGVYDKAMRKIHTNKPPKPKPPKPPKALQPSEPENASEHKGPRSH